MFRKQLLIDQRLIIGRYDRHISGLDANPAAGYPQYDPKLLTLLAGLCRRIQ